VARDDCRLQVGLPDPVATESEIPRSAHAAGKAAPPHRWAARALPRTAAARGYSGRAPRGLPAWESRGRRWACDSSGSAARLDPDLAPPALRPRLRGIPSERVFAAATVDCRRCGGPGSVGFASGSGSPGAGDGALGGGLARWSWLHRVGGDLLDDLTGVSDAAWTSRSFQLPAALAVPCGSRWVASGLPDADAPSALVLEGLAPDFATTSGDGIFNFAFVFHID